MASMPRQSAKPMRLKATTSLGWLPRPRASATGHRVSAVAFAAPQAHGGDGRCGVTVLDFSHNSVEVTIERPRGLVAQAATEYLLLSMPFTDGERRRQRLIAADAPLQSARRRSRAARLPPAKIKSPVSGLTSNLSLDYLSGTWRLQENVLGTMSDCLAPTRQRRRCHEGRRPQTHNHRCWDSSPQ